MTGAAADVQVGKNTPRVSDILVSSFALAPRQQHRTKTDSAAVTLADALLSFV